MLHFTPEMHDTESTREWAQQLHIYDKDIYKLYVSNLEEQAWLYLYIKLIFCAINLSQHSPTQISIKFHQIKCNAVGI